jgi:enoyl-CoA hydratase
MFEKRTMRMMQALASDELLFEKIGALGLFTLNRPKALNALNDAMVDGLKSGLEECLGDDAIKAVLIRGAGAKAFCAGGDIRLMHDYGKNGQLDRALKFWACEYRLNAMIHAYPKPYIALIDGIVMGGGVGVSLHGSARLAGPNYLFAMPEVGIGFFPDVGASYALPRLKGAMGRYLTITGARLRREDALFLKLATHAIKPGSEAALIAGLSRGQTLDLVLEALSEPVGEAPIAPFVERIDRYFAHGSLPAIFEALRRGAETDIFAAQTLAGMEKKSPMSMAISLEQMKRGGQMSFEEAMIMEYRIVSRITRDTDFYEGVRAVIIDKDNAPKWQPATIEALDSAAVEAHFAPLPVDLTFGIEAC